MMEKRKVILTKAAEECGLSPDLMLRFISLSWVSPADPEHSVLDDEDISRARLIAELQRDFGINDEAIPVILQLLDQLHSLHNELTRR